MAKRMSAEELLKAPVHQPTVFVASLDNPESVFKRLTVILNTDGGQGGVIFGVRPDGTVVGIPSADADGMIQALQNYVQQTIDPPLSYACKTGDCEEGTVIVMTARRPLHVPFYEFEGHAYIVAGTSYRALSVNEKTALVRRRPPIGIAPWHRFTLPITLLWLSICSVLALYALLMVSAQPNPWLVSWMFETLPDALWLLSVAGGMLGGCARGLWFLTLDIYGFEHRRRTGRWSAWLKQIYKDQEDMGDDFDPMFVWYLYATKPITGATFGFLFGLLQMLGLVPFLVHAPDSGRLGGVVVVAALVGLLSETVYDKLFAVFSGPAKP